MGAVAETLQKQTAVRIRWMIGHDMAKVLGIEAECFRHPWTVADFLRCLRQRNCIGMVADYENQIVGFMIYELHKNRIHVLDFAVAKDHRRRGVGRQMVAKLVAKLSSNRRTRIVLDVPEKNLDAQLFLRALGFRATQVLREPYPVAKGDAYRFELSFDENATQPH